MKIHRGLPKRCVHDQAEMACNGYRNLPCGTREGVQTGKVEPVTEFSGLSIPYSSTKLLGTDGDDMGKGAESISIFRFHAECQVALFSQIAMSLPFRYSCVHVTQFSIGPLRRRRFMKIVPD